MNLLLVLLLAIGAFFLINEGLIFFGFIAIILLVLSLMGGGTTTTRRTISGGDGGPDVILEQEEPDIPSNIDIKVKPNWEANTLFEDMFAADGEMVDTIGRGMARFLTDGKYGKPKGHQEEEPEFMG